MQRAFVILFLSIAFSLLTPDSFSQSTNREKKEPKVEKIKWYSFEDAYQLNKKKQKKIFVDVYTDWCGWCKKMDADTFTHPLIVEYMNDNFYCVKLDAERKDTVVIDGVTFTNSNPNSKRSSHQLAVELLKGKMSYPSYVFLNEKSQWLTVVPGYQPPKEFESVIHYFGDDAYQKTPWEEYKATFIGKIN
jgi:thioredoxin-related protein